MGVVMKQIPLRIMVICTPLLMLGIAFIAIQYYPNYARMRSLVELETAGFHAEQWANGAEDVEVHGSLAMSQMSHPKESDGFSLTRFTRIDAIWCGLEVDTMPTDDVLFDVRRFPEIQELNVTCHNRITGSGLRYMSEHMRLRRVYILNGVLSDSNLHYLSSSQSIEEIDFTNQPLSDAGLAELGRLTRVRWLSLSGTRIRGRFLEGAAYRNELEGLEVADTDLDDTGLWQIEKLANLKYVDLSGCIVDMDTVDRLKLRGVVVELDSKSAKTFRKWRLLNRVR